MIPKQIHQTSRTREVSPKWAPYQRILLDLHPGWSYKLWTDDDNAALLGEHYPDLVPIYRDFPSGAMKADLMRYVYMYRFGGLYLDLDYEFLKPFDLTENELVLPRESREGYPVHFGNCVFASVAGHPFWKALLDEIRRTAPSSKTIKIEGDVTEQTGPGLVTRVWSRQFSGDRSVFVPPQSWFHPIRPETPAEEARVKSQPETYGIHWCFGTWRTLTFRSRVKNAFEKGLRGLGSVTRKGTVR